VSPEQVRTFQAQHTLVDGVLGPPRDWLGKPLRVDGDLGDKTRWAMAIATLDPRRQAIVRRACSKIGQAETPGVANRGPWPDFVLRRCGIFVPDDLLVPMPDNAWCGGHASWCVSVDGLPARKEAGARKLAGLLRPTRVALPGDFGWFPTGPWQAHIFPLVGGGPGEVAAAEGNHGNRCELVRRSLAEIEVVSAFPEEPFLPELVARVPPGLTLVPVRSAGTR
jgi:hypothetical protein